MSIYRVAVMKEASIIIAVHNHPSGILQIIQGRQTDHGKTNAAKILGFIMDDYLIINTSYFLSFKQNALI